MYCADQNTFSVMTFALTLVGSLLVTVVVTVTGTFMVPVRTLRMSSALR